MVIFKKKKSKQETKDKPKTNDIDAIVSLINQEPKSEEANQIFAQKHENSLKNWFNSKQGKYFFMAYLFVVGILFATYLLMPISKVNQISVSGNYYLSSIYAKQIIENVSSDYRILNIMPIVDYKLEKSPWINQANSYMDDHGNLRVDIVENQPIGYFIDQQDIPMILFNNQEIVAMNSYTTDIISSIPLIHDFKDEDIQVISNALKNVNQLMIESIAEIARLETSYDPNMIMLTMADGNYFIGSRFALETLNQYNTMVSQIKDKGVCFYSTDNQNVVYTSACPWVEKPERPVDYFLDCEGNPMVDHLGNPIAIQYLTDANGNYIYDANGYKTITNQIEMPDCTIEEESDESDENSEEISDENQ